MITEESAIKIAKVRATEHVYFADPHLESVQRQAETGNWVIKFLSFDEEKTLDKGAMYQYITVDKATGRILAVDIGGGS